MPAHGAYPQQNKICAVRTEVRWVEGGVWKPDGVEKHPAEDFCRDPIDGAVVVRN